MSLRNVIGLSLDASITPEASAERKEAILALSNPAKRAGALALHRFATRYPNAASTLTSHQPLTYVGAGADATVYRRGSEVIKVLRESARLSEEAKRELAKAKAADNHTMLRHFSDYMLEQLVFIDRHPLPDASHGNVVQILQPYSPAPSLDIFATNQPGVRINALYASTTRHTGLGSALSEFAASARSLHDATGLLPDTNGGGNLLLIPGCRPSLVMIDGQPIPQSDTRTQDLIMSQLDSLDYALASISNQS